MEKNNCGIERNESNQYLSEFDKKYNDRLLSLFKSLLQILDKEHLSYWVAGGTALGAIRHNGLIPWDDDIDIQMPRKDYEFFLSVVSKRIPKEFEVITLGDEGYYLTYAKFVDAKSTLWEFEEYPFIMGVFIDIFPLDFSDGKYEDIILQKKMCLKESGRFKLCYNKQKRVDFSSILSIKRFLLKITICRKGKEKKFLNKYRMLVSKFSSKEGQWIVNWSIGAKTIFERTWFNNYVEIPFCDFSVRVPQCYHEYLTCIYGDYTQLPPVEKRKPMHSRYYINLEERLTLDEVRSRMEKGEFQK